MARVYVSTSSHVRKTGWARVRDFNGLPNWHPAIADSRIEGGEPADKIGACAISPAQWRTAFANSCWALDSHRFIALIQFCVARVSKYVATLQPDRPVTGR